MSKRKGPSWWRMFAHQRTAIESIPDEEVGKGLKAAFRYFDGEDVGELSQMAFIVFATMRPYIDESKEDYERSSAAGRKGSRKRWENRDE